MIKTKQELLNHFTDINVMYNNPFMYQTLSNMIDELLEQQPCEDMEVIQVSKGTLKSRQGRFVIYDVDWLKKNFYLEENLYGQPKNDRK